MKFCMAVWMFPAVAALASAGAARAETGSESRLRLKDGWTIQSSARVSEKGEVISTPQFKPEGWHRTSVPSTVVAALVADKTYPDPYFGMNLRSISGTTYPIGANFGNLPMPADSPFRSSWWYRTEFRLPRNYVGRTAWLHFDGINYRANIWLNGRKLADANDVAGAYRTYEFNATAFLLPGQANVLAVEVFAQTEIELGINWQDWNPAPPDKDMGFWGDVYLTASGPVTLRSPQVTTHFPDASLKHADLTVMAELHNASEKPVEGVVDGLIENLHFEQRVELQPGETRSVIFAPEQFALLRVENPKLWWPALLGPQSLHSLRVRVSVAGSISDEKEIRFGIREIASEFNEKGSRLFRVNGKRILIRGGGWAQDMLLRRSRERLETQFRYVRDMNLNTIRLEGQLECDDFYDLADEQGILVMPGWVCCTYWEQWEKWQPGDLPIATESLRSQILRLRSHPSLLVWANGSDKPPPANVEKAYIKVLQEAAWPNPFLSSVSATPTSVTGPTGVSETGPYDYEPPSYWLTDPGGNYGGAYGFNPETSPGPAIPTIGSLRKMLPPDHLWPIDEFWNFHASSESFSNLNRLNSAMNSSYGPPTGLEDYVKKAQAMAYDAERAMFEAFARNKYTSTGVIQWMLNNAWPSLFWHLYDYYLQPAGGYFGTKKACEPIHVQYSYDDRSVVVVNSLYQEFSGLAVTAKLYDFDLKEQFSRRVMLGMDADSVQRVLTIPSPTPDQSSAIYFLKLTLQDAVGKVLSSNFYWLSSKPATIDWAKTLYFDDENPATEKPASPPTELKTSIYTPASHYDDLTMLSRLPKVRLSVSVEEQPAKPGPAVRVRLQNHSQDLAFQVHLGVHRKGEDSEALPVLWDDNYVALMPGESRTLTARYQSRQELGGHPELVVDGWNIEPIRLPVSAAGSGAGQANGVDR